MKEEKQNDHFLPASRIGEMSFAENDAIKG
jgi:hypothetical protein